MNSTPKSPATPVRYVVQTHLDMPGDPHGYTVSISSETLFSPQKAAEISQRMADLSVEREAHVLNHRGVMVATVRLKTGSAEIERWCVFDAADGELREALLAQQRGGR